MKPEIRDKFEIREMIKERSLFELRHKLRELDAQEISVLINELPSPDDLFVFRLLPKREATETFHFLPSEKQHDLIESLASNQNRLAELLNDLNPDDRTALLEEMPGPIAQRLLKMLSPSEKKIAIDLLGYPRGSIGRLMTPAYIAVKPYYSIDQTLAHIRKYGRDSETLNVIYVVDDEGVLVDDLPTSEILLAEPEQEISEIMDCKFLALKASEDRETAVRIFQDHDRVALPVTDTNGVLLGIVTVDDVLDVASEEATEDFHRFGSVQDAVFNPLKAKILFLYRKRILWLFALVFVNIFSGAAIANFEDTIAGVVSLVFFLPLLIDSGGNAGAQSATLMIRQWLQVMFI